MSDWRDWGPSRPVRVDGGVRAKSKRGAIGERWWSRRFIEVLESYGMSGRLARGRSYARAGQVLEFSLTQAMVTATVQGSRPRPYQVHIGVLPLTTPQWVRVEEQLAGQALFRAKLLAGEMPREIEEVFDECGTSLFPSRAEDMDMRCSCPDWEVPCKHLAAVCYVLAEAFDADPFQMLAWRGKGREELLGALRREPAPGALAAPEVTAPPLAECLDRYWAAGLSPGRLRALSATVAPATAPDLLLRMFEPPPVQVRGKDLLDVLLPAYERLAAGD
ncbi:MAG TPA: SWIM zinc finger family protein [Streptosporangiaceae bacterium]|nr:SWIM zinc finger family protein [Streptosporangiaceae bacterium]